MKKSQQFKKKKNKVGERSPASSVKPASREHAK